LQRSIGNAAVGVLLRGSLGVVQRNGDRAERDPAWSDYESAVRGDRWSDVARLLNGVSDSVVHTRVEALTHEQRVRLTRQCLRRRPGWAAPIVTAVRSSDAAAERLGRQYADWDTALAAARWVLASRTLDKFNDVEVTSLVALVPVGRLRDLKRGARMGIPGSADRVVGIIDRRISGAVLTAAENMVGHLRWRGGQGPDPKAGYQLHPNTSWRHPDHFARWILGLGPEPGQNSTMNCWEAVLFLAYKAGVIPRHFLVSMHAAASAAAQAANDEDVWYRTLLERMHSGPLHDYTINRATGLGNPLIPAGNIVFFNGVGHVALSRGSRDGSGRMRIFSLWVYPNHSPSGKLDPSTSYGALQDTSVEQVIRRKHFVQYGTAVVPTVAGSNNTIVWPLGHQPPLQYKRRSSLQLLLDQSGATWRTAPARRNLTPPTGSRSRVSIHGSRPAISGSSRRRRFRTRSFPGVDVGLLDPAAQGVRHNPDPLPDPGDGRVERQSGLFPAGFVNHADRPLPQLLRVLPRCWPDPLGESDPPSNPGWFNHRQQH
jgi:hypothetical protein